jgi:general secretion pathway protein G
MSARVTKGFSLIELLIVIVIMGLLVSLVAPEMFSKVDSSKKKTAIAQMTMLQTSIDTYRLDVGDFPGTLNDLLKSEQKGWDGPYLPKDVPSDPWGNPYIYAKPGSGGKPYDLMSYGADGKKGGEDNAEDLLPE